MRVIRQGLFTIDNLTDEAGSGHPHPNPLPDGEGAVCLFANPFTEAEKTLGILRPT